MPKFSQLHTWVVTSLMIWCTSCTGSEEVAPDASISFALQSNTPTGGRMNSTAHAILLTLEDETNNELYTLSSIELIAFGSGYITAPTTISPGTYTITDYLVVDASNNTLFAAPAEGSALDYLVADPLPLSFSISAGESKTISPEVLSVESQSPAAFGYPAYSIKVVDVLAFQIRVEVFNVITLNYEPTTSDVEVSCGSALSYSGTVPAATTQLKTWDQDSVYTISVEKSGYLPYNQSFTRIEMNDYHSSPLVVRL